MRLRRKVTLVTGAASGIGQGVADLTGFGNLSGLLILLVSGGLVFLMPGMSEAGSHNPMEMLPQNGGAIAGTVTDVGGNPLAGFWVSAGDYDTLTACNGGGPYGSASGPHGAYQMAVPPGTYLVYVNSHNAPGEYLPESYPNVNSWSAISQAAHVTVAAGQTVTSVNFSLASGFTLSGRLADTQGQPVCGAGGHIENLNGSVEYGCALGFGSSDADGTFRANVPAGVYDLFFGTAGEGHTVRYGLIVTQTLALGDVLFAEGPRPSGPRALEPGYTAEWFVAPGAFNMPQEILLAPNGDLWVLAVRSQTLYRLDAGGVITPTATGLAAYLGDVDAAGNVYLHGHPQGIIYRIAPDGTKTEVARSPELQAACDSGFGIGPDGNLYVVRNRCASTATLVRITPAGAITALAGGLPPITALRTAPDGRFLAAADNRVYTLSLSTFALTPLGQIPTSIQSVSVLQSAFSFALTPLGQIPTCCVSPGGLAVDNSGNVYLSTGARTYGGQVYRVAPNGQATLLADVPVNGLSGLEWLTATQEVVGGQLRQGAVLAVSTSGALRELVPGNGLVSPMGLAFAPDGALAVANDDGGMMTRVSPQGDVAWFFDYISFTPPMPFVAYAADGTLYASEGAPGNVGRIIRLPPRAAVPTPWVNADWPSGLAREAGGAWLVSETKAGHITRIAPNGVTTTVAAGLPFPQALALDAAGQLYAVTGKGNAQLNETFPVPNTGDTIVKIMPGGQPFTLTRAMDAAALAVAPDGTLFTAAGNRVLRITPQGEGWPFADGFAAAMGLAYDVEGNLYVSDAELNGIARIRGFPQGAVQGRVAAADGTPVAAANVQFLSDWPIVAGGVTTTAVDGTFQAPVAPRTYTTTASAQDYWPSSRQITCTAGMTETVNFTLRSRLKMFLPLVLRR